MSTPDSNFLPNDLIIPQDWDTANLILTDHWRKTIPAINDKPSGQYILDELLTGQRWYAASGSAQDLRDGYRKVIDFGSLPNATTKSVAHGITTNANTTFTRIYATATDPGASAITSAIPIPYVDPGTLANGIQLDIDATNVNITTAIDYTAYTNTYVVVEYLQN